MFYTQHCNINICLLYRPLIHSSCIVTPYDIMNPTNNLVIDTARWTFIQIKRQNNQALSISRFAISRVKHRLCGVPTKNRQGSTVSSGNNLYFSSNCFTNPLNYVVFFYLDFFSKIIDITIFIIYYRGSFWIKKLYTTYQGPKINSTRKTPLFENNHYSQVVVFVSWQHARAAFSLITIKNNDHPGSIYHYMVELPGTAPGSNWYHDIRLRA